MFYSINIANKNYFSSFINIELRMVFSRYKSICFITKNKKWAIFYLFLVYALFKMILLLT